MKKSYKVQNYSFFPILETVKIACELPNAHQSTDCWIRETRDTTSTTESQSVLSAIRAVTLPPRDLRAVCTRRGFELSKAEAE